MVAVRAIGSPIWEKRPRRLVVWLGILALGSLWLGVVAIGTARLWQYELTPGKLGRAPVRWPSGSSLLRSDTLPTLLVFVLKKAGAEVTVAENGSVRAVFPHPAVSHALDSWHAQVVVVPKRTVQKVRLEDRFQDQQRCHLDHPVFDRWQPPESMPREGGRADRFNHTKRKIESTVACYRKLLDTWLGLVILFQVL